MKNIIWLFFFVNIPNVYSQSCEQQLNNFIIAGQNISNCQQLDYFQKVTLNADVGRKFGNDCAMFISENRDKFSKLINDVTNKEKNLDCNSSNRQENTLINNKTTAYNESQPDPIFKQYKDKPLEFENNARTKSTKFSNLKQEDKNKIIANLENVNEVNDFNENEINKLLDIKEDKLTKPIFDNYFYKDFSNAIYKIAEDDESLFVLEDVSGFSFDVTCKLTKTGSIENVEFKNDGGIGSTPNINLSIIKIIKKIELLKLWFPATKNNVRIDDILNVELDVDKYIKCFYNLRTLKKSIVADKIDEIKTLRNNQNELVMNYSDFKIVSKSAYNEFIEFKNQLKDNYKKGVKDLLRPYNSIKRFLESNSNILDEQMDDEEVDNPATPIKHYTYICERKHGCRLYEVVRIDDKSARLILLD